METEVRTRRREQILQAAIAEFCENGYDSAKMEEIARRAGIGKSTVYEYFPSKIELLTATGDFFLEQLLRDVSQMLSGEKPLREELSEYLAYICGLMGRLGTSFLRIMGNQSVTSIIMKLADSYTRFITERLEQVLRLAQEKGEIGEYIDPKTVALFLMSVPCPLFEQLVGPEELRGSMEHLLELLFTGMLPRT